MLLCALLSLFRLIINSKFNLLVQTSIFFLYWITVSVDFSFIQQTLVSQKILQDELSLFLLLLTFILFWLVQRFIVDAQKTWKSLQLVSLAIIICCLFVFVFNHVLMFYISYELSLFPIMLIILKWGKYRNRFMSSIFLFLYTSFFALPLLFVLIYTWNVYCSFDIVYIDLFLSNLAVNNFFRVLAFLVFAVKLPVYGIHFWLPLAHVEAPTFGSIILAGVLLKLGVVGIVRFIFLFQNNKMLSLLEGYFLISIVVSTLVCCFQNDFKIIIAYSSISHIRIIPLLAVIGSKLSFNLILIISLFHGFRSIFFFSLVGLLYQVYGSRNLVFMGGLLWVYPIVALLRILGIISSLPMPPFLSFVGEVLIFALLVTKSTASACVLFVFAILSLVYNLQWFTLNFISKCQKNLKWFTLRYSKVVVLFFIFPAHAIIAPILKVLLR